MSQVLSVYANGTGPQWATSCVRSQNIVLTCTIAFFRCSFVRLNAANKTSYDEVQCWRGRDGDKRARSSHGRRGPNDFLVARTTASASCSTLFPSHQFTRGRGAESKWYIWSHHRTLLLLSGIYDSQLFRTSRETAAAR